MWGDFTMNQELNEKILRVVQTVGRNDYLQRSAIGIARSWVDKRKPVERPVKYGDGDWEARDDLAVELVGIMVGEPATREEYIGALAEARAWVNEPVLDPTMLGQQNRKPTLKPGDKKKGEK